MGLSLLEYRWVSAAGGFAEDLADCAIFEVRFSPVPPNQVWQVDRLVVVAPAGTITGPTGASETVEPPPGTAIEVYAYLEDPSPTTVPVDAGFLEPHTLGPFGLTTYVGVSDAAPLTMLGGQMLVVRVPVAPAQPSPGGGGVFWISDLYARALVASYQGTPGAPQPLGAAVPAPGGPR